MTTFLAVLAAAIAAVACLAHVAWAFGARSGSISRTIPTTEDGSALFAPGRAITLAVAALLATFSALVLMVALSDTEGAIPRWLTVVAAVILTARFVGERHYVGLTKRVRGTEFARLDDRYFTPIVGLLVVGAVAALLT